MNPESANLTTHERHARLVKIVRRQYQNDNPGSRLFPNVSGMAYQGQAINGAGKVELFNPRPVYFGIPEPEKSPNAPRKSGGSDLLGCTMYGRSEPDETGQERVILKTALPILTGIEIKTGKSRLKKNQKIFRDWLLSVNGIYYLARECPECWESWTPIRINGKIKTWEIPDCPECGGKGYKLESGK